MSDSLAFTTDRASGFEREQEHGKKETAEPLAGIQGAGSDEGRPDAGRIGTAVRHPPEPDHGNPPISRGSQK